MNNLICWYESETISLTDRQVDKQDDGLPQGKQQKVCEHRREI